MRSSGVAVPTRRSAAEPTELELEGLAEARDREVQDAEQTFASLRMQAGELAERWARACLGQALKDTGQALAVTLEDGSDVTGDDVDRYLTTVLSDCLSSGISQVTGLPTQAAKPYADQLALYLADASHDGETAATDATGDGFAYAGWLQIAGDSVATPTTQAAVPASISSRAMDSGTGPMPIAPASSSSSPSMALIITTIALVGLTAGILLFRRRAQQTPHVGA